MAIKPFTMSAIIQIKSRCRNAPEAIKPIKTIL
ncbi:Uncharacterised protein [Vibrio cholerae]|nr:Uncharacterised protein [Vibrio cholerae]